MVLHRVPRDGYGWYAAGVSAYTKTSYGSFLTLGNCRQMLAPPVGGSLYKRWGYRAPFIFTILFTILDLPARLLVREREQSDHVSDTASRAGKEMEDVSQSTQKVVETQAHELLDSQAAITLMEDPSTMAATVPVPPERIQLSFPQVLYKLLTSVRTVVVLFCTFCPTYVQFGLLHWSMSHILCVR